MIFEALILANLCIFEISAIIIGTHFDRLHPPKRECNNEIHPNTKFVFKIIYKGKIFQAFRKLIPSLTIVQQ